MPKRIAGRIMLILIATCVYGMASAQTITGKVTDQNSRPLEGASVAVKGTGTGTTTSADGSFTIKAVKGNILVISNVGFTPKEITVGNGVANISLAAADAGLDDVVVVGYSTQKKQNVIGAVSMITANDIDNRPVTNISSSLAGLAPGVLVRQGSGDPRSDGAGIMIRGQGTLNNTSPLVLVDGIIANMDMVNPNDVESISILKDAASASIYGAQAANGVIIITTKKGTKGKANLSYNGLYSGSSPMNMLDMVSDYATYMKLMNRSATNIGNTKIFSDATIQSWLDADKNPNGTTAAGTPNYVAYPNTDWWDAIFNPKTVQNHTLSLSGGTEKTTYQVSAGYLNNPGVMDRTGVRRWQFRANIESKPLSFLTLGTQTMAQVTKSDLGNTSNLFNFLWQSTPGVYPYYQGKYGFAEAPEEVLTANNIRQYLYAQNGNDLVTRLNSTLYAKVAFMKGFSFEPRINYQANFGEYNSYPVPIERWKLSTMTLMSPVGPTANASVSYSFSKTYTYTLEGLLRYHTTIKSVHNINAFAGYSEYYSNDYNFGATKMGLIDYNLYTFNTATTPTTASGSQSDRSLQSYFGSANYDYKGRYLLQATLRNDGASQFAPGQRRGTFISYAAGWRVSDEKFYRWRNIFQNLKLSVSQGEAGNNKVSDYIWQATYGSVGYSFNNTQVNGLAQGAFSNPSLVWEKNTSRDIIIDATALNNRLSIELDLYDKNTTGILTNPSVSATAGTRSAPVINGPTVNNKGIELSLGYKDRIGKEFQFGIGGNVSYNKNTITQYKGALVQGWAKDASGNDVYQSNIGQVADGGSTILLEGHRYAEYFLQTVYHGSGTYTNPDGTVNINGGPKDGMIRTPDDLAWVNAMKAAGYTFQPVNTVGKGQLYYGDLIYADNNGDKIYGNSYDKKFMGISSQPKYVAGFYINASYKGFDVSLNWAASFGMQYYYNDNIYNNPTTRAGNSLSKRVADMAYYYNDANPADPDNRIDGSLPRMKFTTDNVNSVASDFWLYKASYIKLKNLQVGYTLPAHLAKKAHLSNARIFFSGENLFVITKYPGLDPEIGSGVGYPTMRQVALGLNLTF